MKPWILAAAVAVCALLFATTVVQRPLKPAMPELAARVEGTFPTNGQFVFEPFPPANGVRRWGSWAGNDTNTGAVTLGPFLAPAELRFAVTGYPNQAGNEITLANIATGERLPIKVSSDMGERWRIIVFPVPANWVGKAITLSAHDRTTGLAGWLGISEPLRGGYGTGPELFEALTAWAISGLVLGLMWFAVLRHVYRPDWMEPYWAPLFAAGIVAVVGYVAFWVYFASPTWGKIFSCSAMAMGVAGALRRPRADLDLGADVKAVSWLIFVVGLCYLGLLYLFYSSLDFDSLAANRFRDGLPGDNTLPRNIAHALFQGEPLRSPDADWLSSDRPPLQSGWLLLTRPLTLGLGLDERSASGTAAIWLQSIWVFAVFGLWRALGLARHRAVAWVALLACTGFLAQNTVFTWPKLSAAAFACGAFALWMWPRGRAVESTGEASVNCLASGSEKTNTDNNSEMHSDGERFGRGASPAAIVSGALFAGLAWLSHGGVAFSFLPLVPWLAWKYRRGSWRAWALAAGVFAVLAAPWLAYQKFYDPPGNRLFKWHLAGVIPKDARGTWQTIRESYAALSGRELVERKRANLATLVSGDWSWWHDFSTASAGRRRSDEFFLTARALTWWLLGVVALPFVVMRGRLRETWRAHLALVAWALATLLGWCLLMFTPGTTVIHQGSYAVMLVLFVLLSLWLEWASPRLIGVVAVLQLGSFVSTWVIANAVVNGPLNPCALVLTIGAAAGLITLVVRSHYQHGYHAHHQPVRSAVASASARSGR